MRTQDLKDLLEKHNARPIKSRGQHFLLDDNVVAKTIAAADVAKGDNVLEIGPGPGILTAALLDAGVSVTAVELDAKMVRLLQDRFAGRDLRIIEGDILQTDIASLMASRTRYKVVANIPYNITSPILEKFLELRSSGHPRESGDPIHAGDPPVKPGDDIRLSSPRKRGSPAWNDKGGTPAPRSLTLMVQKEVADRIMAKRGDMNALAVFVQTNARVTRIANVARGAFFPPPKVESAIIHIVHKSAQELQRFFGSVERQRYFAIVRAAFQGKRKQLGNSLKAAVPDKVMLQKCLNDAKISSSERPENLTIDDWQRLAEACT